MLQWAARRRGSGRARKGNADSCTRSRLGHCCAPTRRTARGMARPHRKATPRAGPFPSMTGGRATPCRHLPGGWPWFPEPAPHPASIKSGRAEPLPRQRRLAPETGGRQRERVHVSAFPKAPIMRHAEFCCAGGPLVPPGACHQRPFSRPGALTASRPRTILRAPEAQDTRFSLCVVPRAEVAELVDALASGASGGNPVEVQVLSSAPFLCFNPIPIELVDAASISMA